MKTFDFNFINKTFTVSLVYSRTVKNPWDRVSNSTDYRVEILIDGESVGKFTWHDSIANYNSGNTAFTEDKARNVLHDVISDATAVMDKNYYEFCQEFGYDFESKGANKVYTACYKTKVKFNSFLYSDEIYKLAEEISED